MDNNMIETICKLYESNGKNALAVSRETGIDYKLVLKILGEQGLKEYYGNRAMNAQEARTSRYKEISECYKRLGAKRAVAREMQCCRHTVEKALEMYPVSPEEIIGVEGQKRNTGYEPHEIADIIDRYMRGESTVSIARIYGRQPEGIANMLRRRGVTLRKNGRPFGRSRRKRSYVDTRQCYLIAEICLGRIVEKDEVIHHQDENPSNNNPRNLWIFFDGSSHTRYHTLKDYRQLKPDSKQSIRLARECGGVPLLEMIDRSQSLPDIVYLCPSQSLD